MAVEKLELKTYFGNCKCCLNFGYLRAMWDKQDLEDETKSFGLLLTQCFSIEWTVKTSLEDDQICKECIRKLREACAFKKQVLQCQMQMETPEDVEEIKSEPENESFVVEYLDEDMLGSFERKSRKDSSLEESVMIVSQDIYQNGSHDEASIKDEKENFDNYEELNSLDEDDENSVPDMLVRRKRKPAQKNDESNSGTDAPKPKWPRKLPAEEQRKTYKQYSEEAMKNALDAVLTDKMSQKLAAKIYKVPRNSLGAKVLAFKNNKEVFPNSNKRLFLLELKNILQYLNVTPFRSRANHILCLYCVRGTPTQTFSSVDSLQSHMQASHPDRCSKLDEALRPAWTHPIVKLDVKNLACLVCQLPFPKWPNALNHLQYHGVKIEFDNKVIPFLLDDKCCVLCERKFSAFTLLDAHMNKHYRNHVCGLCGETFLCVSRLKTHEKIHEVGRYPCLECDKVFTLDTYRRKHVVLAHTDERKIKCQHCTETFKSEHRRHAHIKSYHKEHVENITCELCGKVFHWMRLYVKHVKNKHGAKHSCIHCGKMFSSKNVLFDHMSKHRVKKY